MAITQVEPSSDEETVEAQTQADTPWKDVEADVELEKAEV
jgi:hypothetical protein